LKVLSANYSFGNGWATKLRFCRRLFLSIILFAGLQSSAVACVANFNFTDSAGTFQFRDSSFGNITYWYWEFGDFDTSSLKNPKHTYAPGAYRVKLTIYGDSSCVDTISRMIYVYDCNAAFSYIASGKNVTFFSTKNLPPTTTYFWEFGDGDTLHADSSVVKSYQSSNTFKVKLTVSNSGNKCSDTDSQFVYVNDSCFAHFSSYTINESTLGFFNNSLGGVNASFVWNFGDNTTSTKKDSVQHIYAAPGKYNVCLAMTDPANACTTSFCTNAAVGKSHTLSVDVKKGPDKVHKGTVSLFRYNQVTLNFDPPEKHQADTNGVFNTGQQLEGFYLVHAAPQLTSPDYQLWFPTYWGGKVFWDQGEVFEHTSDHVLPLDLLPSMITNGPGTISGFVIRGATLTNPPGNPNDPMQGVVVLLLDETNKPLSYAYSDADGYFVFRVPYGTYKLHAEIAGKTTFPYVVTLTAGTPESPDFWLRVNNATIDYTLSLPTATEPVHGRSQPGIFPNPAGESLMLNSDFAAVTTLNLSVTDMAGKELLSFSNMVPGGPQTTALDVSSLAPGIYILRGSTDKQASFNFRFIRQ
jgi:PKD repeat protein